MIHLEEDVILRYVNDIASDTEQFQVEDHLSGCETCLGRIRALFHLRENFDSLWDSWTALDAGRLFQEKRVSQALTAVAGDRHGPVAEKARRWLEGLKEGVMVTLEILVDRSERLASSAASLLPPGYQFALQAGGGVGSAEDQRRLEDHRQRSSDLLSSGAADASLDELREAAKISPRRAAAAVSEISSEGIRKMEVIADSVRGIVTLKYWSSEGAPSPELALLLPGEGSPPIVVEFEELEGESYLLAEFLKVPSGNFAISVQSR